MQIVNLTATRGLNQWKRIVARSTGAANPDTRRQDPLTMRVFGRPVSPREAVAEILEAIRTKGDQALLRYIALLDGCQYSRAAAIKVSEKAWREGVNQVPEILRKALDEAAGHIRAFHESQLTQTTGRVKRNGVRVYEQCRPIQRVGVYVPGGNAPLVSSVLMNIIPARVAGVREIVMATPSLSTGGVLPAMLYAAKLAGADEIYAMGGAHAIAAMAYGTKRMKRVNKIVGPANVFGTEAKRQLVGQVGIDSLAGPSEILILADGSANPEALAWDLLAQGEHGSGAIAILLSPKSVLLRQVQIAIQAIVREHPGLQAAQRSVFLGLTQDLKHAIRLTNEYAPEHLSLQINHARTMVGMIQEAGAIFIGKTTAQAMGDYTAGPNHVLPTAGTARWSSPLSVRDFQHYTSVVEYTQGGMRSEGPAAMAVAKAEGLIAHARSIGERLIR